MRTLLNSSNYGNDLKLTRKDAEQCSHSGDCEADVFEVMQKSYVKKQLDKLNKNVLAAELKEVAGWEGTELLCHENNLMRWVWLSANDITDRLN